MHFSLNNIEKEKLESLLKQHEKNLDYILYLQGLIWKNPQNGDIFSSKNDIYKNRDLLFESLDKQYPYPNDFVKKNIKWDAQLLRVEDSLNNPYLSAIKDLSFDKGDWSLSTKTIKAYTIFPFEEEYHYGPNYNLKENIGYFDADYSYPSISLFGNEWMSLNPYEIRTMETPIILARGKVLTLGLGLGYFAYMTHLKEEVKEVHIVEMDLELIKLFEQYLLPLFPHPEKIIIHKADAFHFVKDIKDHDYDFTFSDLWHDVSDGLPMYIELKKAFSSFRYTQCHYWIEGSLITYLRLLVIGLIRDEYYQLSNEYNDLQKQLKNKLSDREICNSYDLDCLLGIKGLEALL